MKTRILLQILFQSIVFDCALETVIDFLIQLGMKPCMHLVKISIFSRNNVTIGLIKIMNNFLEHFKIMIFKVIFQY